MIDSAYLVFTTAGLKRLVKGTRKGYPRRVPVLARGEFAVLVTVNIPASAFNLPPIPEANVVVPESAVIVPPVEVDVSVAAGSILPEQEKR